MNIRHGFLLLVLSTFVISQSSIAQTSFGI